MTHLHETSGCRYTSFSVTARNIWDGLNLQFFICISCLDDMLLSYGKRSYITYLFRYPDINKSIIYMLVIKYLSLSKNTVIK